MTFRQRSPWAVDPNATAAGGIPARQENFIYDETGNWVSYEQRNSGTLDIDQTRSNNQSNQIITLATSHVARSDLPISKTYPTGESEIQTYDRQAAVLTLTDPNGSVHTYRRDQLGRLTDDSVTTLAAGVNGAIRRLSTSYDHRGRIEYLTSADHPTPGSGSVVNQVKREYNGIDCLTADWQSHSGIVDGSTPKVQYQCSAAVGNILRRTAIIYPNGRTINYEYGTANSIDDVLNRVQSVHDDDLTVLAEPSDRIGSEMDGGEAGARRVRYGWPSISNQYQYLGIAMPALTKLPQPGVERRWRKLTGQPNGDAGDPYTGYDRFGRIEQMLWRKTGETPTNLVHIKWGYNRASLKTWRKDLLAPSSANQDQSFSYDHLYQVIERQQGLLNINHTSVGGIPAQQEHFTYDETGNWIQYQQRDTGELEIDQTRTNNKSNQIITIDGDGTGVSYDKNGNMLEVPTGGAALDGEPRKLIWDAWNRLKSVTWDSSGHSYSYDAQNRRIIEDILFKGGDLNFHSIYDDQWRCVEYRAYLQDYILYQHIWNPADRWEMIMRDMPFGDTYIKRLYPMKDQLDPVAVCNELGVVQERFTYSAFGRPRFMNAAYNVNAASSTSWKFLFHAEFADTDTGWYNYGYRYYSPDLGRWLSRDPIGENGGFNLYCMLLNNILNGVDILGLKCEVVVDIGHAGSHLNDPSKVPECSAYGAIGCNAATDDVNDNMNNEGKGIPGIPKTNGDLVGPGSAPNSNEDPANDGYNGEYPRGTRGFLGYLREAWDAAIEKAKSICEDSEKCCKSVMVRSRCNSDDANRIMLKHNIDSWCNKQQTVQCPKRK